MQFHSQFGVRVATAHQAVQLSRRNGKAPEFIVRGPLGNHSRRLALESLAEHLIVVQIVDRQRPNAATIQWAILDQAIQLQQVQSLGDWHRADS
jgi:hypothetical protein